MANGFIFLKTVTTKNNIKTKSIKLKKKNTTNE